MFCSVLQSFAMFVQYFAVFCTAHICANVSCPELSSTGLTPDTRRADQDATLSYENNDVLGRWCAPEDDNVT